MSEASRATALPMVSRQKLLEAAAKVFAESGFRGATTRRIAEVAGVNEVTLFRLFGSKSQLMAESFECQHPMLGVSLPDEPGDPEMELEAWAMAHLDAMRQMRVMIRKTMAELEEHPELTQFVCEAKTPHHQRLVAYATRLRQPATSAEREAVRTACTMLSSSIFADAMGRDLVPGAYPSPASSAARKYVQAFLSLLGVPARAPGRTARRPVARGRAR